MALKKCPRCEVNYIREDEKVCNVCRRYMKGEKDAEDNITMCSECGENPAVKGSELCAACLREARRQEKLLGLDRDAASSEELLGVGLDAMEVPLPAEGEIPESELEEIDKELSDGDDDEDEDEEEEAPIDEDEDDYSSHKKSKKRLAYDDDEDDDEDDEDDDGYDN